MRYALAGAMAALLCLSYGAQPTSAHHSFAAEFDGSKLLIFTGTLTKLDWVNPHGWLHMDVEDEQGRVTQWAFEIASPNILRRFDANTRDYFLSNIGNVMSVAASPARSGTNRAAADRVKFMDGRIMAMGSPRYHGDLDSEQLLKEVQF